MSCESIDHVGWQVELAVIPGALEAFRELTAEMVAATRGEPNVLIYERYVSADCSLFTCRAVYRLGGWRCAFTHVWESIQQTLRNLVVRTRLVVYSTPTAELGETLDGFGATYFFHFDGFSR